MRRVRAPVAGARLAPDEEILMRCKICDEPMHLITFGEAAPDYWWGPVPADDDLVYECSACGEFEVTPPWIPPS